VLIPEINNGQLVHLINAKYDVRALPLNKIEGMPFTSREIKDKVLELLS
jgi:2-oxoglutarate ferredoxin oxidoreductase subunit alpha